MAKSGNGWKWGQARHPHFPHTHTVHASHAWQTPVIPRTVALALPLFPPFPIYIHNIGSIRHLGCPGLATCCPMWLSTSTSELPTEAG